MWWQHAENANQGLPMEGPVKTVFLLNVGKQGGEETSEALFTQARLGTENFYMDGVIIHCAGANGCGSRQLVSIQGLDCAALWGH